MGDAVLSNAEERIIVKNSVFSDDRRETAYIPTAIVKPKYQKLSFDERQLPIRGSTETDEASFDDSSATITTTPRKVQKHLPKNQKSFAKQNRKLKSGEICSDFNVPDKMAINPNRRRVERDIECNDDSFHQQPHNNTNKNSVAIVQPIKKVIDTNIMNDDEKISIIEKEEIDYSINSEAMKNRNSVENKISITNESSKRMSDRDNLKNVNRKCADREKIDESEVKKVPTAASKKLQKIHSGKFRKFNFSLSISSSFLINYFFVINFCHFLIN